MYSYKYVFNLLITSFFNFIIKVSLVFVCNVVHVEIGLACAVPGKCHDVVIISIFLLHFCSGNVFPKIIHYWNLPLRTLLYIFKQHHLRRCGSSKNSFLERKNLSKIDNKYQSYFEKNQNQSIFCTKIVQIAKKNLVNHISGYPHL